MLRFSDLEVSGGGGGEGYIQPKSLKTGFLSKTFCTEKVN